MRQLLSILMIFVLILPCSTVSAEQRLTDAQKNRADIMAAVCSENWEEYGVLPSVCIAQAFVESTLGEHCCASYNLWGIASGGVSYSSLEDGTLGYIRVINNGYYKGAPGCKDYSTQISRILAGGYCYPVNDYYDQVIWAIHTYHLDKYDEQMFRQIEKQKAEKKRQKKWNKVYSVKYDPSIPKNAIACDTDIIKKGAVCVYYNKCLRGIYDVIPGGDKYTLYSSDFSLLSLTVKLVVKEEAKG